MKNFVKALPRDGVAIAYLKEKFPRLSIAKIEAGIFDVPQIWELMKDVDFQKNMNSKQFRASESLKAIIRDFLGNRRSPQYESIVQDLLSSYQALGARMSIKVTF